MKRVYIIALSGALLILATTLVLKSTVLAPEKSLMSESENSLTGGELAKVDEENKSTTTPVNKPATKSLSKDEAVVAGGSDAEAINVTTDSLISDVDADNSSLNSETDEDAAVYADLQNYNDAKNSSYDN